MVEEIVELSWLVERGVTWWKSGDGQSRNVVVNTDRDRAHLVVEHFREKLVDSIGVGQRKNINKFDTYFKGKV